MTSWRTLLNNHHIITVYIILLCSVLIVYLLITYFSFTSCFFVLTYCYLSSAYTDHVVWYYSFIITFENTHFVGNWRESRSGSNHRKTTHTKQTRPGYIGTNTHALTGKRTNWRPKILPSSFHTLILKRVRPLLFLSGQIPTHTPTQNNKQFICETFHTV